MSNYSVGVDDGHGYNTPGKRTPDGYPENEFNHYTKEYLMEDLRRCGITPIDCSPSREDNSLMDRCNIANRASCNVFVSIHYNAFSDQWRYDVEGIETYFWSGVSINTDGGRLAELIHKYLIQGTQMRNRGVKSADYCVLRETNMPAALVECGFMDNPNDAALMKSEAYRRECSAEICRGICEYFGVQYVERQAQGDPVVVGSEKERAIQKIKAASQWADKYIKAFEGLEGSMNIWGLINKL